MGITGELVRSVFSKSQSIPRHGSEKRKWSSSVRSYLCGDEHSSVVAAEDSSEVEFACFRSNVATNKSSGSGSLDVSGVEESASEATVEQPLPARKESRNSTFRQEDAAFIIQSAFRNFMARRAGSEEKLGGGGGTSVEVQTHIVFSIKEERDDARRGIRRRTSGLKIQEDWDDSTVSSVISKMRMQNRLEAASRRERALAYAFSQQLRICSKKHGSGADEANMGWSWLERWMAARQPEMKLFQDSAKAMDHEKESCGSNEVSSLVHFPNSLPNKARPLPNRSFSRQTSTSAPKESKDVKNVEKEKEKEKRKRQKQPGFNKRDAKNNATALQVALRA